MSAFGSFEDFLAALATGVWSTDLQRSMMDYTRDLVVARRFADAINGGLELSPEIVDGTPFTAIFRGTIRADVFGNNRTMFEDDSLFTTTRFAVMTSHWQSLAPLGGGMIPAAANQLARMFAAGQVIPDVRYLAPYKRHVERSRHQYAQLLIPVHFPWYRQQALDAAKASYATPNNIKDAAAVTRLTDHIFRANWLPSAVGKAEASAAARSMSPSLLRELYADVWEAGYEGHHVRMRARTSN